MANKDADENAPIESTIAQELRNCLAQASIGESILDRPPLKEVCSLLEWYIPGVLCERHPEWRREGLDGVIPALAQKTGKREAEIYGLCILISDQTLAPCHLRLRIGAADSIKWLELRLGERTPDGMRRVPYDSPDRLYKQLHKMALNIDVESFSWAYKVTFGDRIDAPA